MPKTRVLLANWLPVLVWMWLIFSASSDEESFEHSFLIIAPIVRWLFPHLPESGVDRAVFLVRKGAHLTEYAILALLLCRALRSLQGPAAGRWRFSTAGLALLLVALYAASDEFHQLFVPSRKGSIVDVLLDTTGGALGLLLCWAARRALERWRRQPWLRIFSGGARETPANARE